MSRRVWNCPRLELSMKACRVEDTEDRHRGSTALHAMDEKMENKELTKKLISKCPCNCCFQHF